MSGQPASQHTPGPWTVAKMRDTVPHLMGADHCRIALLDDCHLNPTAKANARLIAAAPDLLAALSRLLDCPDLNLGNLEPGSEAAIADARAVLERIGGES